MSVEVRVPAEQEGTKAVVRAWLKQIGDTVAENDPLVELETDKVTQEVPAPAAGVLSEILLDTDAEAVPGAVLGRIAAAANEERRSSEPVEGSPFSSPASQEGSSALLQAQGGAEVETRLSPSVRRALLQHDIDPDRVQGTGRNGRITREDVDRAVELATVSHVDAGEKPIAQPRIAESNWAAQDIPHDRMRLKIAENMVRAVGEAPHVTALFEADFSAIAAHKAAAAERGKKLSYTAYLIKAAAEAMAVAPAINGRWAEDRIAVSPTIDIGVGTALGDKGLVVPVAKNAGALSLEEIGAKLDDLTRRAREGKLTGADVSGGSFTISNHGVSGSLLATPIILHQGQAAILGVGKLEKRVVVREVGGQDAILVRPMAYVTLTIDHRVVDGHQTNAWLTRFVEVLENWPKT
ncbi:MAG: Dihydrolipoamide acyltransferase component of branched-chain alpha-keto acid dehydrogenase complex [uncultured Sphingomonas sp.]|uniref:Dihydrolipoamide acetyltransferase component of pyruvate dehydrogenase complex n=1 Tax=uncultured Sphingomonas sp. TaxID=158754 RepID=A0A6J4T7G3_9SPHN|nr:2-oxo acid dehydrogenase subunit E2 [uncultured Sphingomonas sp.]CAA9516077.1 MAG: Dihydrolipoamide acyltransferase component of branched-chain alpha-keto acid dehydrogenase complex [uncultured Sphingomonas sp.]